MKYLLLLQSLLFATSVAAMPSPEQLNLEFPLISSEHRSNLAGESCRAIRHGVEPEFIKGAILYKGIITAPLRNYRYSEARKLADDIYAQSVIKCQLPTTTATK
jgi:hypothetical protein